MTQLGLIVAIDVIGLLLALLLWRGVSARDVGPPHLRRLGSAIERATRSFMWQQYRLVAAATVGLLVLAVAASLASDAGSGSISRIAAAFWAGAGLCLGALGATVSGYAGTALAVRGSVRSAAASAMGIDRALTTAVCAAGAPSLFGEALSSLSIVTVFGLLFAVQGGFAMPNEQALALAHHVVSLLPSFALGAVLSALIQQRAGGTFHAASGVGAEQAGEREAGLDHDDPRNPAVIAELVGDHVGASATRHVDAFAGASVAGVAALIIGVGLSAASHALDPLMLVWLPLILRAFGAIASGFGLLVVRSDETSSLPAALLRGYSSTAVVVLSAIGGTAYWLFGEHFLAIFWASAAGLVAVVLAAHCVLLSVRRRSSSLRDSLDAVRLGAGGVAAMALASGFQALLMPIGVLGLGLGAAIAIGAHSDMSSGVEVCVFVFALATLSVAPFASAVAAWGAIIDSARGAASLSAAESDPRRRAAKLDDAAFSGAAVARQYAILAGAVSSLLAAWAILGRSHTGSAIEDGSAALHAASVWCGALGAAVALGYAGSTARAAARGARDVCAEVERQLRGFPREYGVARIPPDYTPSYKTCVELTATVSLRRVLLPVAGSLAVPVALGIALRLCFHGSAPELVPAGLGWFVVVSTLTGLGLASALDAARVNLGCVRRTHCARDNASAFNSTVAADASSDILGNAAGPALLLLVKASAAAALIITPFLP